MSCYLRTKLTSDGPYDLASMIHPIQPCISEERDVLTCLRLPKGVLASPRAIENPSVRIQNSNCLDFFYNQSILVSSVTQFRFLPTPSKKLNISRCTMLTHTTFSDDRDRWIRKQLSNYANILHTKIPELRWRCNIEFEGRVIQLTFI